VRFDPRLTSTEEFAEGAEFNPNYTLIKIDDAEYKLAIIRAEARVAEAHTALQRELATALIKKEQWDDRRTKGEPTPYALNVPQVAEARAKIRSADAELAEARLNLQRTEVSVPFLGRVMEKSVGVGQFVNAGTKLGRVFSTDKVEIRLPLTDMQLVELQLPLGFMASTENAPEVTLKTSVGNEEHSWKGRIVRTQAAVDQQTRQIRTVNVLSTSTERVLLGSGVTAGEQVVTSTIPAAVDGMQVKAITRESES
jgi:multidrug efflux pump subunit AcrA (membrane-fusion protein)